MCRSGATATHKPPLPPQPDKGPPRAPLQPPTPHGAESRVAPLLPTKLTEKRSAGTANRHKEGTSTEANTGVQGRAVGRSASSPVQPPSQPQQPPIHRAHTQGRCPAVQHPSRPCSLAGEGREGGHCLCPGNHRPSQRKPAQARRSPYGPVRAPLSPASPCSAAPPPRPVCSLVVCHHGRSRPRQRPAAGPPRPPHIAALGRAPSHMGTREGENLPHRHLPRGAHGIVGSPPTAAKQGRGVGG
nr:uncharacterized protein LOC127328502 [Lolium perenne]